MSIVWSNFVVSPIAIGGAATVSIQIDPSTPVSRLRVFVGLAAPASASDTNPALVQADFVPPTSGGPSSTAIWGAPMTAGLTVTIFAQAGGVWGQLLSVAGFDLAPSFSFDFPWSADWIVSRLQDVAATYQPLPGKVVAITRAFPRNTHGWPAINVQVDAITPIAGMVGNMLWSTPTGLYQTPMVKGRLYSLQLSVVAWSGTPEERSAIGAWLGGAMEMVMEASAALGWEDPSTSFRETEDFETVGVPAFLVTANLTVTVQSTLQVTESNTFPDQLPPN